VHNIPSSLPVLWVLFKWMKEMMGVAYAYATTGYTDPNSTLGWGVVDFDWSNGKGTGTADGWAKHKPMDDEEMLFKQVCPPPNPHGTSKGLRAMLTVADGVWRAVACRPPGLVWCAGANDDGRDPRHHGLGVSQHGVRVRSA